MATRDIFNLMAPGLAPLGSGSVASVMSAVLDQHTGLNPYEIMALIAGAMISSCITTVAVAKVRARAGNIRESSKAAVRASAVKGEITPEMAAILLSDGGTPPNLFKLPWRK